MKQLHKLLFIALVACLSLSVSSCSKDDDKDDPSGSSAAGLVINGKKAGKIYGSQCTSQSWSEDWGGGYTVSFDVMFDYDDDMTNFSITWPFKLSSLKAGMDLLDRDTPNTMSFRSMYSAEIGADYYDFDGQVIVKSISDDSITLKFVDFRFTKSLGERTYTINGTVTYDLL